MKEHLLDINPELQIHIYDCFFLPETQNLFDLSKTLAASLLRTAQYPWEILPQLSDYLLSLGKTLSADRFDHPQETVWIAKTARIAPSAQISGPCIIDENAEIRQSAFLRGSVLVGKNAVVGNSTELKNALLFDGVQVPHFNYVGDSILGYKAHLGAGAITSNVKSDKSPIVLRDGWEEIPTSRKKLGAILGDGVEVGCNTVLNPGTVIGKNTTVYPLSSVRGTLPQDHIYKDSAHIVPKTEQKKQKGW